ncbi:MAG: hypothetical protein GY869_05090 [Planctomycetes bacterium]|nr:hypothetical protein [Planctomycetota bacterium]
MKLVNRIAILVFLCLFLGVGPMGCDKGAEEPVVEESMAPVVLEEPVAGEDVEAVVGAEVVEEVDIATPVEEVVAEEVEPAGEGLVVEMEEVSALNLPGNITSHLTTGGLFMYMGPEAKPEVKQYPEFVSEKPLYGLINTPDSITEYYFALDETGGTGKGYDRIYCDLNCDLDLTNDTPANRQADRVFETLTLNLETEEGDTQAVLVRPNLLGGNASMGYISFNPMQVRQGELELDGKRYTLILTRGPRVSIRYDGDRSQLYIVPGEGWDSYGIGTSPVSLKDVHTIGRDYFTCSTSAAGEQLTFKPLVAEMGIFEVGAGGRNVDVISMDGSLKSEKMTITLGGGDPQDDQDERKYELPLGDYMPMALSLRYGKYSITLLNDFQGMVLRDIAGVPRSENKQYRIAIREDKPFVLDFSNEPEIRFTQLKNDQRVKAGSNLQVNALLVDPVVGFKFRLMSKSQGGVINPTVTVARANGEKLVEGVMPYG